MWNWVGKGTLQERSVTGENCHVAAQVTPDATKQGNPAILYVRRSCYNTISAQIPSCPCARTKPIRIASYYIRESCSAEHPQSGVRSHAALNSVPYFDNFRISGASWWARWHTTEGLVLSFVLKLLDSNNFFSG